MIIIPLWKLIEIFHLVLKDFWFDRLIIILLQLSSHLLNDFRWVFVAEDFHPFSLSDEEAFTDGYCFVYEKGSLVVGNTICTDDVFVIKLRQIAVLIVDTITDYIETSHEEDNFAEFIKFFNEFDVGFFSAWFQSL